MSTSRPRGFTLVELLVVITIIVVLLTLMAPALETAIYRAELVRCAARLDGISVGLQSYAVSYNRGYPDRDPTDSIEPHLIFATAASYDYRPAIRQYTSLRSAQCTFTKELDLEYNGSLWIWSNYDTRAGFAFKGYRGMLKIGDKWEYTDSSTDPANPKSYAFDIIVSDYDTHTDKDRSTGSHPDKGEEAKLQQGFLQDNLYYASLFTTGKDGVMRGPVDLNWAFQDGSTRTVMNIERLNDERVARVASWGNGQDYKTPTGHFRQVPKP